jgi:UDP-galactopyranose mutase
MSKEHDYLVVGAGLFGSVFAREVTDSGKKCVMIDSREHIGGNCYSENKEGIHVSKYGGHIFHTNNERIWSYVNKFTEFRPYHHLVRVKHKDNLYSFPINLMTLNQIWGITTPDEAKIKLEKVKVKIESPKNLEEWVVSQVGWELYDIFFKGYTSKQWNKDPKDLPAFIAKRIPIRMTYDSGYFSDKYQGWPQNGYTSLFVSLQKGIPVVTGADYFRNKGHWDSLADKIVFTGKIDEYFNYCYGELEYRSLRHEHFHIDGDHQGCATVNYADPDIPYTRIIEHKHFQPHEAENNPRSIYTVEYPDDWNRKKIPFYPINDKTNNEKYSQYRSLAKQEKGVIFGGRLAEYKYYDMHQIVGSALSKAKKELEK